MKKRIAILSALLLMTGCTGNVTLPGSQPSQSSQTSQTSPNQPVQSNQPVRAVRNCAEGVHAGKLRTGGSHRRTAEHRARKYRGASGKHADRGSSRNRNG